MPSQFVDTDRQFDSPPPRRGIVTPPPHVVEMVARERERLAAYYTDAYEQRAIIDHTLDWYYQGEEVAYRVTEQGIEVLAVGEEAVVVLIKNTPPEQRLALEVKHA